MGSMVCADVRDELLALGYELGFTRLWYSDREAVNDGAENWRAFATAASLPRVTDAVRAARAVLGLDAAR